MNKLLLIGIGSGIGGVCRFGMANFIYHLFGKSFPIGTLVVNVFGCFLMGLLFILLLNRVANLGDSLRALLLVGFLGGFTTFSSFSIETLNLYISGAMGRALLNVGLSVTLCLLATAVGISIGRQL